MSEPYTVEAVASAPSNAVRSHDYPMLESGNLSFPKGRYLLDFCPGEDRSSYVITHRIEGAPLIDRLLESGQAQYACIVSSPISSYRRTHVSSDARHRVGWDGDDLGEPPLFTPMILSFRTTDDYPRCQTGRRTPDLGQPAYRLGKGLALGAWQRHPARVVDSATPVAPRRQAPSGGPVLRRHQGGTLPLPGQAQQQAAQVPSFPEGSCPEPHHDAHRDRLPCPVAEGLRQ